MGDRQRTEGLVHRHEKRSYSRVSVDLVLWDAMEDYEHVYVSSPPTDGSLTNKRVGNQRPQEANRCHEIEETWLAVSSASYNFEILTNSI